MEETGRLWLDDREGHHTVVDYEDYLWAIKYKWGKKPNSRGKKLYAYRVSRNRSIYLHVEIMLRMCCPPTEEHTMVDHIDGDSLNNKRNNLRWATAKDNARNRKC